MSPQIIVSAHATVEITKSHKVELAFAVLEAGVCFGILNRIESQIIQRKTAMLGIELRLNIFFEWLYARKQVKNELT